ncbi:aldehyde dehydrogenase family protein [Halosolutus halophilus]|uniref:aldehyde dehydrogenase family protein n=1 Tax=Halosolutus halophilus TaxID=1552990 RepID=UPI0022352BA6|nr:aldehyde dehydrogenase family protein [Halosolutus halophilus]
MAADLGAGTVWMTTYNDLLDSAPHGGYEGNGMGCELGDEAIADYSEVKTVKTNLGDVPNVG